MKRPARLAAAAFIAAALGACSSPSSRFYTLDSATTPEQAPVAAPVSIVVGPVTIPDLVDRPQIVTRFSTNEVKLNEFARWADPLKTDIARVLAANLGTILNTDQVSVLGAGANAAPAWRIRVDVARFESEPAVAVAIDALWTVQPPGKQAAITGRSVVREPVAGDGFDALISAHNRALASVSRDIAATIRKQAPQ